MSESEEKEQLKRAREAVERALSENPGTPLTREALKEILDQHKPSHIAFVLHEIEEERYLKAQQQLV